MTSRQAVLVAMSGGVDSSVAAALLRDEGHDVVGVTMKLWGGESDTGCCSVSDVDDARRVAQQLGIDHLVFNFGEAFSEHVVAPYVAAHAEGRTPNPCIECNRHLKFDALLARATQLGFDAVATGHHAQVAPSGDSWVLARGADRAKDQSYVLHMLDQSTLARVRLPVGSLTKAEVRRQAAALGLRTAAKADSQEVCFITSTRGREGFLSARLPLHAATVVECDGQELGRVDAVELVTVGQRRGVGSRGGGERQYVVDVDVPGRRVVVGPLPSLLVERVRLGAVSWVNGPVEAEVLAQCSAHGRPAPARVMATPDGWELHWHAPQRRVAPGQAVVLYDLADEHVLGGAPALA